MSPGEIHRPLRVGILDGRATARDALARWIAAHEPRLEVVVSTSTWADLVRSPAFPTDLVLMGPCPDERVVAEARLRTCRTSGVPVIVIVDGQPPEVLARVADAGALALVPGARPPADILAAVKAVLGPVGAPLPLATAASGAVPSGAAVRPRLSDGERRALLLYAAGDSTRQVAAALGVQFETAKTYLRRAREKYVAAGRPTSTREDLARRAREDGYLDH